VIDTQVMAAFAGRGDQLGLAALVHEVCGIGLAKDSQWSAWDARPLTAKQLAYADSDVRHLPDVYRALAAQLGARLAWARAESSAIASDAVAAASITADNAWQALGGLRGLDAASLGVAHALAAWRFRVANELDRPLGWVLTEKSVLELARARPSDASELRAVKHLSGVARQRADELIAVIASAPAVEPAERNARAPSQRAQRWTDALVAIAHVAGHRHEVATRLVATRDDAERFARSFDEGGRDAVAGLPALAT
jgi:ribonuclease D